MSIFDYLGWQFFRVEPGKLARVGNSEFVNGEWVKIIRPFYIKNEKVIGFSPIFHFKKMLKCACYGLGFLAFPYITAGGDGISYFLSLFIQK